MIVYSLSFSRYTTFLASLVLWEEVDTAFTWLTTAPQCHHCSSFSPPTLSLSLSILILIDPYLDQPLYLFYHFLGCLEIGREVNPTSVASRAANHSSSMSWLLLLFPPPLRTLSFISCFFHVFLGDCSFLWYFNQPDYCDYDQGSSLMDKCHPTRQSAPTTTPSTPSSQRLDQASIMILDRSSLHFAAPLVRDHWAT